MDASCDFETRSVVDLRKAGVYRYAEDPTTDVWCFAFYDPAADEIELWRPGMRFGRLGELAEDPNQIFRAWNAQFERIIWREIMAKRYGFPEIPLGRWRCTAAEAAALALPRSLDGAARVLKVMEQKDMAGHRLMLSMAKPRRIDENGEPVWWDVPDRIERLLSYNKQDVRTEMAVKEHIRDLTPYELEVYRLDQRINDRGVRLDDELAYALSNLAQTMKGDIGSELRDVSDGAISGVTDRNAFIAFMAANGVDAQSISKEAVQELLSRPELPDSVRRVLELRAEGGKSSLSKVDAMFECVCDDGMMRGLLLYHAAHTGRWSGKLIQPQNMPARSRAIGEGFHAESWREPILGCRYDLIDLTYPVMEVGAMMLRACLRARPGHKFIGADFAAIEARVLAWLADEKWLLSAFANGEDVYKMMASKIYRKPIHEISKPSAERDMGKRVILGCGFGMGWEKFIFTCAKEEVYIEDEFAQQTIRTYRDDVPKIMDLHKELNRCAVNAVRNPGAKFYAANGKLVFVVHDGFLKIVLPNRQRALSYYKPRLVQQPTPWGTMQDVVRFQGEDSNHKWREMHLYGGLLAENVTQAIARDIMVAAMFRMEALGYLIVLSVHDELLFEVPLDFGSVKEAEREMAVIEPWSQGCPVKAEGWTGPCFQK